jgi:hypothetical protein
MNKALCHSIAIRHLYGSLAHQSLAIYTTEQKCSVNKVGKGFPTRIEVEAQGPECPFAMQSLRYRTK